MALINRKNKEKIGINKIPSESSFVDASEIKLDVTSKSIKKTLVSDVVNQLMEAGYTGNLLSAGMTYANQENLETNYDSLEENFSEIDAQVGIDNYDQDKIVGDIDFDSETISTNEAPENHINQIKTPQVSAQQEKKQRELRHNERIANSQSKIKEVGKSARNLYGHIDEFITCLRDIGEQTQDNPILMRKLEHLRQTCVDFVRAINQQIPHYATSLFVSSEEKINEKK